MEHPTVTITDRTTGKNSCREVKHLGWLLAHAKGVQSIIIEAGPEGWDCRLHATGQLEGQIKGRYNGNHFSYSTPFASLSICREWIKRPSLSHAEVLDISC